MKGLVLAAATVTAAALVVAGCGGVSLDPVAKAAAATQDEQSMKVDYSFSSSAGGQTVHGSGTGVFDSSSERGRMSMQIDAQGKTVSMDMVSDGLVVYMRSPVFAQSLPDGKQWLKIDMQKAAQAEGIDMSSMLGGSAGDDLAQLRATSGDVQKVGEEQVAGVDTTHYRATVDFDKAAANAKDDATAKSYRRLAQLVGSQTIPVDVWVDGDDHVRKLDERFSMTTGGKQADMEMSMTFVDFGQQVDVQLPADSDTVDAASLTQKPHA